MSVHLPPPSQFEDDVSTSASSESEDDNDQNWDDWASDSNAQQETKSLFDEKRLPSVESALAYDKETYNFSLDEFCKKKCKPSILSLDGLIMTMIYFISTGLSWPCPFNQLHPKTCMAYYNQLYLKL